MDESRNLTIVQGLREALREEMLRDESVFVMGEDIGIGGSFLFTLGFLDEFGPERVMNTPISEVGFVGMGVGAAIEGMRPVIDFQYGDFLITAADQVIQQAAKLRYMSGGQVEVPLVFQLPTGASGRGAQHSNSLETVFFGVPGLEIVTPSSPYDAKGLFKSAVRSQNPVLFCVHKHLYGSRGRNLAHRDTSTGLVPDGEDYTIPFGVADIKRAGTDVTVVANLLMLHRSLKVASGLADEGISVEVIDPRTLVPFDLDSVIASVEKTGRLVLVDEGPRKGGWSAHVAAEVAEKGLMYLDAPIERVTSLDTPMPYAPGLEEAVVPSTDDIEAAIRRII
ncbi:MAG: alpha-ketoacid dehydrogenase subunit beta [Actinobacteria bacterium]|nr:alpha-ketoacid dehydrogenase subunit beta [Actinomycetota bacterium]